MNFQPTEEQSKLVESVSDFVDRGLDDAAETSGGPGSDRWRACADFGILGLPFATEYGGLGEDALTTVLALERLGRDCRDLGLIFAMNAQMWGVQAPLARFGSEEHKARFLAPLVDGSVVGAHCMTEPGSGSDAFALRTRAERDGDRYLLNGRKTYVTNAPAADVFLVFATVDPERGFFGVTAFVVERSADGLSVSDPIEKMGLASAPMADVVLEDCAVPVGNRIGEEGNGAAIFRHSMKWERCCILASHAGSMQRQIDASVEHARSREQFGRAIASFQSVSHRIVDMKVRLEAGRLLLYRAAQRLSGGRGAEADAAMAKLVLSESAVETALDAIQTHGGYGYCTEAGLERELRDAVGARIYSGTSDLQREVIAESLGLGGRAPGPRPDRPDGR